MSHLLEFSLVVATAGRLTELDHFLLSLCQQKLSGDLFEVIICDQNEPGFLNDLVSKYSGKLKILHLYSTRKSISYSRNLGIDSAKGRYLTFPDDDCLYYADTLYTLSQELKKYQYPEMLIGTVYDRTNKKYVFKKTPTSNQNINFWNFHVMVSSISIAVKNNNIKFDERFGIGEKYHSNEDADLILTCLESDNRLVFSENLQFFHPPYSSVNMSSEKLLRYGIGFGALCRKHFNFPISILFFKVIVFQLLMITKSLATLNRIELLRRWNALKGRIIGFKIYRP